MDLVGLSQAGGTAEGSINFSGYTKSKLSSGSGWLVQGRPCSVSPTGTGCCKYKGGLRGRGTVGFKRRQD